MLSQNRSCSRKGDGCLALIFLPASHPFFLDINIYFFFISTRSKMGCLSFYNTTPHPYLSKSLPLFYSLIVNLFMQALKNDFKTNLHYIIVLNILFRASWDFFFHVCSHGKNEVLRCPMMDLPMHCIIAGFQFLRLTVVSE